MLEKIILNNVFIAIILGTFQNTKNVMRIRKLETLLIINSLKKNRVRQKPATLKMKRSLHLRTSNSPTIPARRTYFETRLASSYYVESNSIKNENIPTSNEEELSIRNRVFSDGNFLKNERNLENRKVNSFNLEDNLQSEEMKSTKKDFTHEKVMNDRYEQKLMKEKSLRFVTNNKVHPEEWKNNDFKVIVTKDSFKTGSEGKLVLWKLAFLILNSDYFFYTMHLIIIFDSIILIILHPLHEISEKGIRILDIVQIVFYAIFIFEAILRMYLEGINMNKASSYFRKSVNITDFILLVIQMMTMIDKNYLFLKGLLCLRLLRLYYHYEPLKTNSKIVNKTIISILNLSSLLIVLMTLLIVNIVFYWKGKFFHCNHPALKFLIMNKDECIARKGQWINQDLNFDNILNGFFSFLALIQNDDWINILYNSIDAVGVDQQPQINHDPYLVILFSGFFYLFYVVIFNLFIGVVIYNFQNLKELVGGYLLLNEMQKEWFDLQKSILKKKFIIVQDVPQSGFKRYAFIISKSQWFKIFNYINIFVLLIIFATFQSNITAFHKNVFVIFCEYFFICFNIEIIIEVLSNGQLFFRESLNRLVFFKTIP